MRSRNIEDLAEEIHILLLGMGGCLLAVCILIILLRQVSVMEDFREVPVPLRNKTNSTAHKSSFLCNMKQCCLRAERQSSNAYKT